MTRLVIKLLSFSRTSPQNDSQSLSNETENSKCDKKYLKEDLYLQLKDKKLLMIWDQYKSVILKYQKIMNFLGKKMTQ